VDVKIDLKNRGIGRGRMFLGALLLLAAALTWGIGLMMSPHGETVAHGTEHLRTTVVTFKRNGAVGTLILCALAAWLLFPGRRPKWPTRDWALIALFAFLVGSSIYTLIWLRPPGPSTLALDGNFATTDANMDWNASTAAPDSEAAAISPPPTVVFDQSDLRRSRTASDVTDRPTANDEGRSGPIASDEQVADEQSEAEGNEVTGGEVDDNVTGQNQE
jgi:hypothetical protein